MDSSSFESSRYIFSLIGVVGAFCVKARVKGNQASLNTVLTKYQQNPVDILPLSNDAIFYDISHSLERTVDFRLTLCITFLFASLVAARSIKKKEKSKRGE